MSIASKTIAGCTPIAGPGCNVPPFIAQFWGPTSVVYEPVMDVEFVAEFWGPTSIVFNNTILVNPDAGEGDCITACPHENVAYAYALDDSASVNPQQQCDQEAA